MTSFPWCSFHNFAIVIVQSSVTVPLFSLEGDKFLYVCMCVMCVKQRNDSINGEWERANLYSLVRPFLAGVLSHTIMFYVFLKH